MLPLSGADAKTGQYINDAYVLYTKQVNDKGGLTIAGKKVKLDLRIEDNKDDGATSAQLYEKLITQDNVDFLLGGYNTALVTQEIKVANRYKIPYVTAAAHRPRAIWTTRGPSGLLRDPGPLSPSSASSPQRAPANCRSRWAAIVCGDSSHGKSSRMVVKDGDAARFRSCSGRRST